MQVLPRNVAVRKKWCGVQCCQFERCRKRSLGHYLTKTGDVQITNACDVPVEDIGGAVEQGIRCNLVL
ncbi:hypothetical protein YC2023_077902 [Brassica napus]